MRVLFLLPYMFIPPDRGNKHLTFNLLKYVTTHADCDLILMVDRAADKDDVRLNIRSEFPSVGNIWLFDKPSGFRRRVARLRALARGLHPSMGNYWNKSLAQWLQKSIGRKSYDIVHFDMFHMAQYQPYCHEIPSVLVPSDAYSLSAILVRKATSNMLTKIRMTAEHVLKANIEREYYGRFDLVCPVAKVDTDYLRHRIKEGKFRTIGIAIGSEFVAREPRSFEEWDKGTESKVLYVGPIAERPVAECLLKFLRHAYPRIREIIPKAQVTVMGRNPAGPLRRFFRSEGGIQHIEFVDDYIGFLEKDWVYVHPQQTNAGFQTKVQQAMASGLPVVGFELAFTGMDVESGKHCFICRTQEEFTAAALTLLQDPHLRRRIGLAAASRIRDIYSVEKMGREVMGHYEQMTSSLAD